MPVARTDEILGERRASIGHQRRGSTVHQKRLVGRHRLHDNVGKLAMRNIWNTLSMTIIAF